MEPRPSDRELCRDYPEYRKTFICWQLEFSDAVEAFVAPIRARLIAVVDWISEKTKSP